MICAYPRKTSVDTPIRIDLNYPCGKCLPCQINKRSEWTGRLILESLSHETNPIFFTLTYNQENLPPGNRLQKRDLQLFFKRVRNYLGKFRYFGVGEYGEKSGRAHYHAIIFGLSIDMFTESLMEKLWPYGFTSLSEATRERLQYVSGYTVKKFAKSEKHPDLPPEFAIMSRNPAIGTGATQALARKISDTNYRLETNSGEPITISDINNFRMAGKQYPIGRTLKEKIISITGMDKIQQYAKIKEKWDIIEDDPELYKEWLDAQRSSLKNAQKLKKKKFTKSQI